MEPLGQGSNFYTLKEEQGGLEDRSDTWDKEWGPKLLTGYSTSCMTQPREAPGQIVFSSCQCSGVGEARELVCTVGSFYSLWYMRYELVK